MKKAFVFLTTGFEETEAIGTVDVLRRGGIEATTVSITGTKHVSGAHGIEIKADVLFANAVFSEADILILPGGMPGSTNLNAFEPLKELLIEQYKKGKTIAAICAAPLVFGGLGLVQGKKATCYPGFEPKLIGATITGEATVTDGQIITGKGPGFVFDFALTIVENLRGKAVSEEVAAGLLL
ncbi:MAG: DJ-1/PfpI family protein [Massilibacteroides sp.]|nr:DJ-1/PfpI family protein [Massilibacteroides sp.]MDD3061503.1 DJ-1/PfpI family protein [Massilibacteroides sp.]MDD4115790.1 DJ-1/PfpI family protein [Massilibacteroides sp.]MDD4659207.1 DJ-1/PfpI family protein [Massilibacteroides sp.]